MAIDCTDDVALRSSICNINTDLEQMIINEDGVLTTNYGAKPIKQLVREGVNNDLQALGIDYVWATATERAAQTGMVLDEQGYQIDTKEVYKYNGTSWIFYYSLGATEFSDNTFKIVDGARSATTGASFQFSTDSIATGSNIIVSVPNYNIDLAQIKTNTDSINNITSVTTPINVTGTLDGSFAIVGTDLVATNVIGSVSNGFSATGSIVTNDRFTLDGILTPTNGYADGDNYLKTTTSGTVTSTLVKPIFGLASVTADYYLDGLWYNSSDVVYNPQIAYLSENGKLVKATASGGSPSVITLTEDAPNIVEKCIQIDSIIANTIKSPLSVSARCSFNGIGGISINEAVGISGITRLSTAYYRIFDDSSNLGRAVVASMSYSAYGGVEIVGIYDGYFEIKLYNTSGGVSESGADLITCIVSGGYN